ncbi:MAG: MATE family efflux transporter [Actinomycetota bacterium]
MARLAVPALGTLVAEPLYVLADTAIVGRLGTDELAGLALASTVLLSVHALMIFLAYGTTATVSRLIGAGEDRAAARQSVQGLWLAALLGVVIVVLLVPLGDPLLRLLGGEGEALDQARIYLRISLAGIPFLLLTLAGAGASTGRQDTRTPLRIAVAGAIANLVIESVLIFGLGFEIGASALATVIAQVGTGLVFVAGIVRWGRSVGAAARPERAAILSLLSGSWTLVLRSVALRGSFTLAAAVAARLGTVELAAHQVAVQIWGTLTLALDAVAIAGQALTGRWLGAGDAQRARTAARRMIELDIAVGAVAALVILAVREPVAGIFSNDAAVVAAAAHALVWVALTQPLSGYVFALDGVLIGAGDLRYLARSMLAAAVVFAGLAAVVLAAEASLGWLWSALVAFMVLRAVALWWRWRGDRWVVTGVSSNP